MLTSSLPIPAIAPPFDIPSSVPTSTSKPVPNSSIVPPSHSTSSPVAIFYSTYYHS